MTTTTRLLCIETTTFPIAGCSATRGDVIDVVGDPFGDAAQELLGTSNPDLTARTKFFSLIGPSGPTTARPIFPDAGDPFVDTTINKIVRWDGAAWRDVTGASV